MYLFFFLCKGKNVFYTVLCTDINDLKYYVVKTALKDVYDLLHGNIPMRDIFLRSEEYWEICSADTVSEDRVTRCPVSKLDISLLPDVGACYEVLTGAAETYVRKFDNTYFAEKMYVDFVLSSDGNWGDLIERQFETDFEDMDYVSGLKSVPGMEVGLDVQSVLRLENLVFDKIEFTRLGDLRSEEKLKMSMGSNISRHQSGDSYRVTLTLKGKKPEEYVIEISLTGIFKIEADEHMTEELKENLLTKNARADKVQ